MKTKKGEGRTLREQLEERRSAALDKWAEAIAAHEAAVAAFDERDKKGDVSDEDRAAHDAAVEAFNADIEKREAEVKGLETRVKRQDGVAKRRAKIAARSLRVSVRSEPLTYRQDNAAQYSYFRDLACAMIPDAAAGIQSTNPQQAQERLWKHAREMDVEMPKRAEARSRAAKRDVESAEEEFLATFRRQRRDMEFDPFERRVNPNRTDGQGGFFVPPLWLIDQYIPGLRAGRVAAGLCRQMALPPGTDSINIPKLANLTQVGIQGADNAPVTSVDYTDTSVQANVKTLAGQEDVGVQLVEQSPGQIVDQVITEDLMADYNKRLDLQVIQGNGTNSSALNGGQVLGIYPQGNWPSTNLVTYTTGSPAPFHMFAVMGAMQSNVAETRFFTGPSFAFVAHPRRAFWLASGVDANNRPLIESSNFGPFNVMAIEQSSVPAEGLVMQLPWGPRLYHDANVPSTDNGSGVLSGTNDVVIGAVWDDAWLFEGEPWTRVLPEVLSGTLQLRYQIYNYIAFLVRYGQSLAIVEGTGLAAPTGNYLSGVTGITF